MPPHDQRIIREYRGNDDRLLYSDHVVVVASSVDGRDALVLNDLTPPGVAIPVPPTALTDTVRDGCICDVCFPARD